MPRVRNLAGDIADLEPRSFSILSPLSNSSIDTSISRTTSSRPGYEHDRPAIGIREAAWAGLGPFGGISLDVPLRPLGELDAAE